MDEIFALNSGQTGSTRLERGWQSAVGKTFQREARNNPKSLSIPVKLNNQIVKVKIEVRISII